jgi:hypothetical protein
MIDRSQLSTARRTSPKTTAGIRCVAAYFILMAFGLTSATVFMVVAQEDFYSSTEIAKRLVFSLSSTVLLVVISIGLYQRRRFARWAAVATSLYIALSGSVIGILLFMYLIRPEHDGRFA